MRLAPLYVTLSIATLACSGPASFDPCAPGDSVLENASFVLVVEPTSGARVASPMRVRGCSRTAESNVVWRVHSLDGSVLASGHTSGGGIEGPAPFSFSVLFEVPDAELGHLEVFEQDMSDGEGFPPSRNVIPIVLMPSDR